MNDKTEAEHYPSLVQVLISCWGASLVPLVVLSILGYPSAGMVTSAVFFIAGTVASILLGRIGNKPPPVKWLRDNDG